MVIFALTAEFAALASSKAKGFIIGKLSCNKVVWRCYNITTFSGALE
jgi:hypothetical protein